MTAGNGVFQQKTGAGWSRGLDNLLGAELGRWFLTKKWWVQILLWAAIINGILALVVTSEGSVGAESPVTLFNIFLGVFATFGVCILMQGVIVGEKQSGTAAWVLSKPVSRPAFLLAKLTGNTLGIAVTILLVQGIIAYLIIYLSSGTMLPLLHFLGGLGMQLAHHLFYITLTLLLGAAFSKRGPVVAIPLLFLFAQELLMGVFPVLAKVLPWTLVVPPDSGEYPSIAAALMTGSQPVSYLPLVTTLAASVLFVALALWIFERQEF